MGYYDEGEHSSTPKRVQKRSKTFMIGLLGAFIGAITMVLILPVTGSLISDEATTQPNQYEKHASTDTNVEQVSADVHSDATEAVQKIMGAVVSITNLQTKGSWGGTSSESTRAAGAGSGVIYKKRNGKAYIVTNHHVIEGASQIEVTLDQETRVKAKLLGSDPLMDLAVLVIDGSHVTQVAEFGNSDQLDTGESVIAIGNTLGVFSGTVTKGIVSNPLRTIPVDINGDGVKDWRADVIQTDASINPGNSGGALINMEGDLVGINSMKISSEGVEGIGFAIPINIAKPIIEDLEKYGEVKRPYMGISFRSLSTIPVAKRQQAIALPEDVQHGVIIMKVQPDSPAREAGLKPYDVITSIDGEKIKNGIELRKLLYTKKSIGDEINIEFYRQGQQQSVQLTLGKNKSITS